MDSVGVVLMILDAIDEFFSKAIWFCCGWFLIYVTLGTWLKVYLVRSRIPQDSMSEKRFGPVLVSHLLFSVLLVNPYTLLWLACRLNDIVCSVLGGIFSVIIYFMLLPIVWESLLLRVVARWRRLSWFQWRVPLKRVIPASLAVSLIAFVAGYVAVQIRDVVPIVVRAFPFRPAGFSWKVDTVTKSLEDLSVTAQTGPMIMDDEYVYVRINSKEPTWTVVDRKQHKLLSSESNSSAYVLADDSAGTWQIQRDNHEVLCSRISGMDPKRIAVDIPQSAMFLEHQTEGLIIGADPESSHLFAFDPKTGTLLWKVRAPPVKGGYDRRIGSIASTGDVIIAGLYSSRVWAVDIKTGQQLWLFEEAGMGNPMHVEASKSGILGFSRSGKVYSFSPRTGELKWSKEMGDLAGGIGKGNVCLLDDKVIFRNETTVTCSNVNSGEILWQSSFGDHYSGGIACSDKGLVVCASDRAVAMFDLNTGKEIFRTKLPIRSGTEYGWNGVKKAPGRIYAHPIVTAEQEVYVFTGDGVLWVLKPKL